MKKYKAVLQILENNNLFGSDFKSICRLLSSELDLTLAEIKTIFLQLENKKQILLSGNKVCKGELFSANLIENMDILCGQSDSRKLAGSIVKKNGKYLFLPIDYKFGVMPIDVNDDVLKNVGKRCCCNIVTDENGKSKAVFEKVFGYVADPITENEAIAFSKGFSAEFSPEILREVENIPQSVLPSERQGRLDLTDKFLITCDPASCKDKDDAVYAEKQDFGYRVYVAIADVSHYVKSGSLVDKEALKRGTSCYLGSGVYPMLPQNLSNGICSLNEHEDRLSLVSIIDIDYRGNVLDYKFAKAVINVHQSFCYEEMEKLYLLKNNIDSKYKEAKPVVNTLYHITDILENKLDQRGALKFISNEPEYKFNEDFDKVLEIKNQGNERSHTVIEQLMILANEVTAQFFKDNNLYGIYRTHSIIDESKLAKFNSILTELKIKYKLGNSSQQVNKFLKYIKGNLMEEFLQAELQKTLSKARYNFEQGNHFGLASKGYTHFTSPIRRYADTTAHRIISEVLSKQATLKSGEPVEQSLDYKDIKIICDHLNEREKAENDAERLSDKFLASLWAEDYIGQTFEGMIYKFARDALVIKKDAIFIEIPYFILNDNGKHKFVMTQDKLGMVDCNTYKKITIGDKFAFQIGKVDKVNYTIFGYPQEEKTLTE